MPRCLCWMGLLLGGWSVAAAPEQGRCAFGVTITASHVIFEKTRVSTEGARYACELVSQDRETGLVIVEPPVMNAIEDATILYFKPKVGLIWRTSANLIGATQDEYLFASDNDEEPLDAAQVYRIHKITLARRITRIPVRARPGCGEIEFFGQGTTFRTPNLIQVSRVDGCGLFFKTVVLR
ncbi:hypothetical protein [Deinococcus sp. RIT780]|uniref:hypothetical protein n=1 Tax=Deinococcus sp. RIT780 TaxID=2870472 RepID=UPI001C8983E1|nr:hypothetical protein [Deinococcus sp. RIT780]MBX8466141.1 hypothetical protein [Deinococcus sp. RIT780]